LVVAALADLKFGVYDSDPKDFRNYLFSVIDKWNYSERLLVGLQASVV